MRRATIIAFLSRKVWERQCKSAKIPQRKWLSMNDQSMMPQVIEHYNEIADQFATISDQSFFNEYCERPAMFSLLDNVTGKRVLDAGCGHGRYAEWLLTQGATVTAVDASEKMVHLARHRLGEAVDIRQLDLSEPLDIFTKMSFDVIVSPLVLDYIQNWHGVFGEFHRILDSGGIFVFSVMHPFFIQFRYGLQSDYFSTRRHEEQWGKRWKRDSVPAYRRSLTAMTLALSNTGFGIDRIIEPKPIQGAQQRFPEQYEEYSHHPVFICFRVVKL